MSIFLPKFAGDDYSAMRGPCPDGFHIPSKDDWVAVYDAGITIGAWTSTQGNNISQYLKLPFAGSRDRTDGTVQNQGSNGLYTSCFTRTTGTNYNYKLSFTSNNIYSTTYEPHTSGLSIRPFSDTIVVPDSSWTALYSNKIYHNSTLGLISISSDGTNWITIADKNLGATTVYNYGDTLSEANCGKYYQWGNNYGFPFTGTVTTSSTQVDAGTYGPGNYYSSSTFITNSTSPYDRSSVQNDNLRGGVTGVVQNTGEPKKIYIRVDAQPITTAGIYHNSDLGLISLSSDGTTRITIADKNLGATTVYNSGDTLSEANSGKYYQWGNNYGFPFTGSVTTSSTQVDASTYGPGNYYSSSTFITNSSLNRSNPSNNNLWGGETGTVEAMQGPCNIGYHIPNYTEMNNLYNIGVSLGAWTASTPNDIVTYLKIPKAGYRGYTSTVEGQGTYTEYWTSEKYTNSSSAKDARILQFGSSSISIGFEYREYGLPIRPFANTPTIPTDDRTVLYQ